MPGIAEIAGRSEIRLDPVDEGINHRARKVILVVALGKNVRSVEITKTTWNLWPRTTPVAILTAHKNAIGLCIAPNVVAIRRAVRVTVVRIELSPGAGPVAMVNVVAKCPFPAIPQVGLFWSVLWLSPIVVEGDRGSYAHDIYESSWWPHCLPRGSNDPIANGSGRANPRFAGS